MNIKYLYTSLSIVITAFLVIAAIDTNGNSDNEKTNKDIIKFSHALHKEATDCASCHVKVTESTSLNDRLMPDHDA